MNLSVGDEVASLKSMLESQGDGNDAWTAMVQNCICSARSQLALQKSAASSLILALFQEALTNFQKFRNMVRLSQLKFLQFGFLHAVPAPHERFAGSNHRWPGRERVPTP